ncbi:hypothetical protein [Luteibacter yeojuensis]|uniref:ASCH domain-containing protein n=1 Tax=Luteibacter yeojuensis TaxID=345309 RepID=A0A7X5TP43_9GAMM|nr:hypothetical protein [Luteibacter yeojuensis]NID14388.1 hypothetical protein [Luteibacter yeojuensis]
MSEEFVLVPRDLSSVAISLLADFPMDDIGDNRMIAAGECWEELLAIASKDPPVLQFKRHIFKPGRNTTVRRGSKWDGVGHALIDLGDVKPSMLATLSTTTYRFNQVSDHMLRDEHDPSCRTVNGLLTEMQRVYPGFSDSEDVTLVNFYLPSYAGPTP